MKTAAAIAIPCLIAGCCCLPPRNAQIYNNSDQTIAVWSGSTLLTEIPPKHTRTVFRVPEQLAVTKDSKTNEYSFLSDKHHDGLMHDMRYGLNEEYRYQGHMIRLQYEDDDSFYVLQSSQEPPAKPLPTQPEGYPLAPKAVTE
jgi:hypothetical protein